MVKKCIRLGAILLALVLTVTLIPLPSAHAADADLTAIVEKQIRAYADSIDQRNADGDAAWALANHGINGGGKKLSAGASHPLTATLMNSELLQADLIDGCGAAIRFLQQANSMGSLYLYGNCSWYGTDSEYQVFSYHTEDYSLENRDLVLTSAVPYTGKLNSYDSSLDWMAAGTYMYAEVAWVGTTAENKVYRVTCTVKDRFDFSTAGNSGFSKLISGLGSLLFREFDWESTVTFELTVPYSCTHTSASYHWIYDAQAHLLTADNSGGYAVNEATQCSYTNSSGAARYYHLLNETVRLYSDKPWAIEYKLQNPWYLVLAPFKTTNRTLPYLVHYWKNLLSVRKNERVLLTEEEKEAANASSIIQSKIHHYGTPLEELFQYSASGLYTFRLENMVEETGENMIWLTVYNEAQELVLDKTPLDDYYLSKTWEDGWVLQDTDCDWVSGKDILINYVGNESYYFSADQFDLKIWENGEGGESFDYFESKTVAPTCTEEGYTAHTCAACGYSYKTDMVPATGHSYTTKVTPPTCTEDGYTTYTCSVCKDSYTGDTVKALKHSYGAGYCSRCGDDTVTAAIVNGKLDLRATRGIKVGTWALLCGYTTDGRMTGFRARLWDGTPQTIDLPVGENFKVFFVKEGTWVPLRNLITPQ